VQWQKGQAGLTTSTAGSATSITVPAYSITVIKE